MCTYFSTQTHTHALTHMHTFLCSGIQTHKHTHTHILTRVCTSTQTHKRKKHPCCHSGNASLEGCILRQHKHNEKQKKAKASRKHLGDTKHAFWCKKRRGKSKDALWITLGVGILSFVHKHIHTIFGTIVKSCSAAVVALLFRGTSPLPCRHLGDNRVGGRLVLLQEFMQLLRVATPGRNNPTQP